MCYRNTYFIYIVNGKNTFRFRNVSITQYNSNTASSRKSTAGELCIRKDQRSIIFKKYY